MNEEHEGTGQLRGRAPFYARASLVLFSLSLAMLGASAWLWWRGEGTLRYRRGYSPLTTEWNSRDVWVPDANVEHAFRCGVDLQDTNELGETYRYRTIPIGPSGTCFRDDGVTPPVYAVAVGDSFTMGFLVPLECCWVERLEKSLGGDVVNLGLNSSGPTQYLHLFEEHGASLRPRVVIVCLYVNDWLDEAIFQTWVDVRAKLHEQVDYPRSRAIFNAVRQNAYRLPEAGWRNPMLDEKMVLEIGQYEYLFDATAYAVQDCRSPTIDMGRASSMEAILALKAAVEDAEAEFVVVVIPAKEQVYHERIAAVNAYVRERPSDTFCFETRKCCEANGVPCLDMLPVLRRCAEHGEHAYLPRDGHFSSNGHRILAESLEDMLIELGLAPMAENGKETTPALE